MKILGIETSCDETAAAVVEGSRGKIKILSNVVSSQIELHKKYGGIVPEVAAREHVLNVLPVVNEALDKADLAPTLSFARRGSLGLPERVKLDALAVTVGPGLITSLIVGIETAKTLAYAWDIPIIGVNHIEGHIYANFINERSDIKFPALILTVSGGHTMLVLMTDHGKYKTIGQTRDDAAGEAFDKAAQLLGLEFPGGPEISAEAEKLKVKSKKLKVNLPRPMINSNDFNFSFSGLKTALLYAIKEDKNYKKRIPEYAHEFQQAVIDVLISKTIKAAKKYQAKTVMLTGGVSANEELRKQLEKAIEEKLPPTTYHLTPNQKYTTDNAAMIAAAGYYKALRKEFIKWQNLKVDCNLEL